MNEAEHENKLSQRRSTVAKEELISLGKPHTWSMTCQS
jgi:outer membrane protein OmpA-like peptidoglycan-associated protein